jgi:hypothetical protein
MLSTQQKRKHCRKHPPPRVLTPHPIKTATRTVLPRLLSSSASSPFVQRFRYSSSSSSSTSFYLCSPSRALVHARSRAHGPSAVRITVIGLHSPLSDLQSVFWSIALLWYLSFIQSAGREKISSLDPFVVRAQAPRVVSFFCSCIRFLLVLYFRSTHMGQYSVLSSAYSLRSSIILVVVLLSLHPLLIFFCVGFQIWGSLRPQALFSLHPLLILFIILLFNGWKGSESRVFDHI